MADINKEQDDKATQEMLEMMGELPTDDFAGADIDDLINELDEASEPEIETALDVNDTKPESDAENLDDIESLMASLEIDESSEAPDLSTIDLPETQSTDNSNDLEDINLDDIGNLNLDDVDLDLDALETENTADSFDTIENESFDEKSASADGNLDDLEDMDAMLADMDVATTKSETVDTDETMNLEDIDLTDLDLDDIPVEKESEDNAIGDSNTDEINPESPDNLEDIESLMSETTAYEPEEIPPETQAETPLTQSSEVAMDLDELVADSSLEEITEDIDEVSTDLDLESLDSAEQLEELEALEEVENIQMAPNESMNNELETQLDKPSASTTSESLNKETENISTPRQEEDTVNATPLQSEGSSSASSNTKADDSEVVQQAAQSIESMEEAISIDQEIQNIASEVSQTAKEATQLAMATTQQAHASAERTQHAIEATFAAAERAFEAAKNAGYNLSQDGLGSVLSSDEINEQLASIKEKNKKLQAVNLSIKTRISEMKPH